MSYRAPIADIEFALQVVGVETLPQLPGYEDASPDVIATIIEQAGKYASDVLAPLNVPGDRQGAQWHEQGVKTVDGWKAAYRKFSENGWGSLAFDPEYGGQGLPRLVSTAVMELWSASNMSFGLCPLLTQGAVDAIYNHGSEALKRTYLPKMVSGEWTGTMNLTEAQAGSDLASIRASATPDGDHYLIEGQKIFITYGDHDLSENIIHLVLARTLGAPAGVKGISLFVVPKFLVGADGTPGVRNDVRCVSIEHKLGIHASPTAVMAYGDKGGAVGYRVGEENKGLIYMFTMMNIARHNVGIQGYALADRAYQQARDFARERVQGPTSLAGEAGSRAIINHPDIRRILMLMRSQIEAMRLLSFECAVAVDRASCHEDASVRAFSQRRSELLIPLVKGWSTEVGTVLCSLGIQVHGGMGFIEETGAAQHLRDVRITPIYEGTTGIQANDLIGRKLARDGGQGVAELVASMRECHADLPDSLDPVIACSLADCIEAVEGATEWMLSQDNPALPAAAAVNYMMLMGCVGGCWMMARGAALASQKLAEPSADTDYLEARCLMAAFYAAQVVPQALALQQSIANGSQAAIALAEEQF